MRRIITSRPGSSRRSPPIVRQRFRSYLPPVDGSRPKRRLVLLIDFDGHADRLADRKAEIPLDIADRVFVIGVWSEPEDLRASRKQSLEQLGKTLAAECRDGISDLWSDSLLRHNASELERLRQAVRPILFA